MISRWTADGELWTAYVKTGFGVGVSYAGVNASGTFHLGGNGCGAGDGYNMGKPNYGSGAGLHIGAPKHAT